MLNIASKVSRVLELPRLRESESHHVKGVRSTLHIPELREADPYVVDVRENIWFAVLIFSDAAGSSTRLLDDVLHDAARWGGAHGRCTSQGYLGQILNVTRAQGAMLVTGRRGADHDVDGARRTCTSQDRWVPNLYDASGCCTS
jgi:hypothetical protein